MIQKATHYVLFILIALFAYTANAQYMVQKRGDYYFSKFSYVKAIEEYQKMVDADFKTNYAHRQLAECYLLIRDFKKTIPHFEAIINNDDIPTDYYFKYAMALRSINDKEGAKKWMKKYQKYNRNDSRLKRFLKNGSLASVVFNSRERYALNEVDFNSPESDFGVFIKNNELYFSSSRINKKTDKIYGWNEEAWLDIYKVNAENTSNPERVIGNINTKYHESSLVFAKDSTVVYFTRNNFYKKKEGMSKKNENNLKIYRAKLIDGEWLVNKSLPINSDHFSTGHPALSPDGKRLYYTSDMPGGLGGSDIYYSELGSRGKIGRPINAGPTVNTEGNEMFPFINSEGKLFFSSDGHVGFGQLDVFSAITNQEEEFIDVINLGTPLNSASDDFAFYELRNGISGYISSNREGGKGGDDIYKFNFQPSLAVEGLVTDAINEQPLDSVLITLINQNTNTKVAEVYTDKHGYYKIFVERKTNYMVEAVRKTHPHKNVYFSTYKSSNSARITRQDIILEPVLDLKILAGLHKIYYDFNKSNIRPDAAIELDKVVKLMTVTYPEMIIRLESHTDPVGSHKYNDALSQRRAKSTYDYLIENGVSKNHILSYNGFGKRKPINECTSKRDCGPEKLELNRRTEFPIIQLKEGYSIDSLAKNP